MSDNIELVAKLRVDIEEAERDLDNLAKRQEGKIELSLPKDTEIKLPEKTKESLDNLFTDKKKGVGAISSVAKIATQGLRGLADTLKKMAGSAGSAAPLLGAIVAAIAVVVKLLQGTDTMKAIQASSRNILKQVRNALAPALALIGEMVIDILDIVAMLAPLFKIITAILKPFLNVISGALKAIMPVIDLISKLFEVIAELFMIGSDLTSAVWVSLLTELISEITVMIKPLVVALDALLIGLRKFKQELFDFIERVTFGAISLSKTTFASTQALLGGFKTSLDAWEIGGGESAIDRQTRLAAEAAASAAESSLYAMQASNTFSYKLNSFFQEIERGFKSLFSDLSKLFESIWEPLKKGASDTWNYISNKASSVWSSIERTAILSWDYVSRKVGEFWDGLKNVFKSIADWFDAIKKSISSVLKQPIEKASSFASNLWGKTKDLFGRLKFWDSGGTLPRGAQIWGMNEKGNPEFIFNAGGHDTVINAEILSNAMYSALRKAGTGGSQTIEVSIKEGLAAGPRDLATMLLPYIQFSLKGAR